MQKFEGGRGERKCDEMVTLPGVGVGVGGGGRGGEIVHRNYLVASVV